MRWEAKNEKKVASPKSVPFALCEFNHVRIAAAVSYHNNYMKCTTDFIEVHKWPNMNCNILGFMPDILQLCKL